LAKNYFKTLKSKKWKERETIFSLIFFIIIFHQKSFEIDEAPHSINLVISAISSRQIQLKTLTINSKNSFTSLSSSNSKSTNQINSNFWFYHSYTQAPIKTFYSLIIAIFYLCQKWNSHILLFFLNLNNITHLLIC